LPPNNPNAVLGVELENPLLVLVLVLAPPNDGVVPIADGCPPKALKPPKGPLFVGFVSSPSKSLRAAIPKLLSNNPPLFFDIALSPAVAFGVMVAEGPCPNELGDVELKIGLLGFEFAFSLPRAFVLLAPKVSIPSSLPEDVGGRDIFAFLVFLVRTGVGRASGLGVSFWDEVERRLELFGVVTSSESDPGTCLAVEAELGGLSLLSFSS
jgi:hypothetical protein